MSTRRNTAVIEPEQAGMELIWLDPRTLTEQTDSRDDVGDLSDIAASIAEIGVIQPLTVTKQGDDYEVYAGRRRRAAAIAAGLPAVPCIVRTDRDCLTDRMLDALAENLRRRNLSTIEEARGYHQLAMAGLSPTAIAKKVGSKRNRVKQAITVADSEVATTVAGRYDLTLTQALVIAEFQDDREAVKLLTVTAKEEPEYWDHEVARLRADRETERAYSAKVEELTAAGITVVDEDALPEAATPLAWLADDANEALDPDAHASCPGHAVAPNPAQPEQVRVYCLDPDTYGHTERVSTLDVSARSEPSGKMTDEQKAERRLVVENNKAWRAAEGVRRDFVRGLLARKTTPKGALRFATEFIVSDPEYVGRGSEDLMADLLGRSSEDSPDRWSYGRHAGPDAVAEMADARLPLILVAQVAAAVEGSVGVHTWRNRDSRAARYLAWLAEVGYTLSDVEALVAGTDSDEQE